MNYESFSVWASSKGLTQTRARRLYQQAELAASRHPRTELAYWTTLRQALKTEEAGSLPPTELEKDVRALSGLATFLRRSPGETSFVEEGTSLKLRYTRNASNGLAYPFTDYCDVDLSYDLITRQYTSRGTVFGLTAASSSNEPGVFFMQSLELGTSYNAVVRDFFTRGLWIAERYTGHNMDLFTYKLQTELRAVGVMERLDASKLPNVATFTAANVPFTAWFALSNLGVGIIKFNPALTVAGYLVSPRTFRLLLEALDSHVVSHQEFVRSCIAAANQTSA